MTESLFTFLPVKMDQTECSEKFRRGGITQKKIYNIKKVLLHTSC